MVKQWAVGVYEEGAKGHAGHRNLHAEICLVLCYTTISKHFLIKESNVALKTDLLSIHCQLPCCVMRYTLHERIRSYNLSLPCFILLWLYSRQCYLGLPLVADHSSFTTLITVSCLMFPRNGCGTFMTLSENPFTHLQFH